MRARAGRIRPLRTAGILLAVLVVCLAPGSRAASASTLKTDLDRDGCIDLVVARAGDRLEIALSSATTRQQLSTDAPIVRVVSADVDADGDLDLVVGTAAGPAIWLNVDRGHLVPGDSRPLHRPVPAGPPSLSRHRLALPTLSAADADAEYAPGVERLLSFHVPLASVAIVDAAADTIPRLRPVGREDARGPPILR